MDMTIYILMGVLNKKEFKILGDKAIIYNSKAELMNIFKNIKTIINSRNDWNAYKLYCPDYVINLFKMYIFDK